MLRNVHSLILLLLNLLRTVQMAKLPNYRQGKRLERFENDLNTNKIRTKNNKMEYLTLEKIEKSLLEEYKQYCLDNKINGYNYFTNIVD